jgi:hypothetical protein
MELFKTVPAYSIYFRSSYQYLKRETPSELAPAL